MKFWAILLYDVCIDRHPPEKETTMTRSYKTSYKTHRNSARFAVTFDAPTIAAQVQEVCTICNGKIEESPMMRGVCYSCYQNLVKSPETFTALSNHVACTLSDAMRDCDNCEFQPEIEPWNVIPDSDTVSESVTVTNPVIQRLNGGAGYDLFSAMATKSPARLQWEKEYLQKREAHRQRWER